MNYQTISLQQFFGVKGAINYVALTMVIFSHVKITCYFHMRRYQVFARKLTWYFIGVYIIYIRHLKITLIGADHLSFEAGMGDLALKIELFS